jgi:hypothetical protein
MNPILQWLDTYEVVGDWAGNVGTAAAILWAFYLARLDSQRAHRRATANLVAADDAIGAMQDYLEGLVGDRAKDHAIEAGDPRLATTPFERFRTEMSDVSLADLPCLWTRRAVLRARATVEEVSISVQQAVANMRPQVLTCGEIHQALEAIQDCRRDLTPSLPSRTPWAWLTSNLALALRRPPARIGEV